MVTVFMEQKNIISVTEMHIMKLAIFLSVLLFFNFIAIVYGDAPGGYVVKPHGELELNQMHGMKINNGRFETVSFWELPMWIKIAYLISLVVGVFSLLKTLPVIVIGKIKNVLENIQRQKIYKYVVNNPSTNIEELSKNLNINRSTLRYHVKILEDSGRVTTKKIGRCRRIYQNSMRFDSNQKFVAAIMRQNSKSKILKSIIKNPGINNGEISEITGLEKSTVTKHVRTLVDSGLLKIKNDGRFKRYFIKENAIDSIVMFGFNR